MPGSSVPDPDNIGPGDEDDNNDNKISTGVIIALSVIGGLIFLVLLFLASIYITAILSRPAYHTVRQPRRYSREQRQMLMEERDEDDLEL